MAVGSRDRPSMLATGRYPQWRSWFLRYIDTRPNGDALRKCILRGPYKPTTVLVQAVAATNDSLAIPEHTTVETTMNMSPENKAYFQAKKEAIHLILTRIRDEIYSIVDACQTAHEMWEAIERIRTLHFGSCVLSLAIWLLHFDSLRFGSASWSCVLLQDKLRFVSRHVAFCL
nr:hypothetical protein [Tanacetum cinerariifolium]